MGIPPLLISLRMPHFLIWGEIDIKNHFSDPKTNLIFDTHNVFTKILVPSSPFLLRCHNFKFELIQRPKTTSSLLMCITYSMKFSLPCPSITLLHLGSNWHNLEETLWVCALFSRIALKKAAENSLWDNKKNFTCTVLWWERKKKFS